MERDRELAELQRRWSPPAELTGPVPREVRLSGRGIGLAVMAGVMILAGIATSIYLQRISLRESAEQKLLEDQGQNADGRVVRLWQTGGKNNRDMVTYQFEAEGRTYRNSTSAPPRIWNRLSEGMPLAIRYLPLSPTRNHPQDWVDTPTPLWLSLLFGALLAGAAVILVFSIRRQMGLLREGRPAPGVVTRHSYAGKGQRAFHYDFAPLGGSVTSGKSPPTRRLAPVGATVCVIYDPENPRRNAPYPMEMVKVVNFAGGRQ